jgi:hypothetical protein
VRRRALALQCLQAGIAAAQVLLESIDLRAGDLAAQQTLQQR